MPIYLHRFLLERVLRVLLLIRELAACGRQAKHLKTQPPTTDETYELQNNLYQAQIHKRETIPCILLLFRSF